MSSPEIMYHEVIPENLLSSYGEFDNVDMVLSAGEGRSLDLQSIRIEGELSVVNTAGNLGVGANETKQIVLDHLVGAHSFFESFTTAVSAPSNFVVETLNEYPRYVKMSMAGMAGPNDMNNSNNVCEMKAPNDNMTNNVLQGVYPNVPTNSLRLNPDFSIRPLIALNSGNGSLPYRKSGDVRLSFILARKAGALFGKDMADDVTYSISDLRCRFTSSPDDGSNDPVVMKTKIHIKQSIQSSQANINTRAPGVCFGMSASFQTQTEENTNHHNNLQLNAIPNLRQTQFQFNNSSNTLISYIVKDNTELLTRYIDSFLDTGRNSLSLVNLANNNGFGIGLDFDGAVDLRSNKFSLQLLSDIASNQPMLVYMYFHSVIEL